MLDEEGDLIQLNPQPGLSRGRRLAASEELGSGRRNLRTLIGTRLWSRGRLLWGVLPSSHPPEHAGNVPTPTKNLSRLGGILPTFGTCWAEARSSKNTGVGTKFGARKVFTESAATNIHGKLWHVGWSSAFWKVSLPSTLFPTLVVTGVMVKSLKD